MISRIADHLIDLDILPLDLPVLDLGCRNGELSRHFKSLGYRVFSVDMDDLPGEEYFRCAIGGYDGKCGVEYFNDPNASRMGPGNTVRCFTLDTFSKMVGVEFYGLVKMDIEGAEKEVIMSLVKAPAKSLSIEFHMQCGQTKEEVEMIVQHLESLGYERTSHKLTREFGAGENYWSSLFILK